jgi:hypothetical protein
MISHLLRAALLLTGVVLSGCQPVAAQVLTFENNGLHYQSLTRKGVTIMCARLKVELKEYGLLQVAISNGSDAYAMLKPEDFTFTRTDGRAVTGAPADNVVAEILERGNHSDLVKLVTTYENAIYGIPNMKLDNGYEKRRQAALAEGTNARFKAAAAASAIALIPVRVPPGKTSDGAVFFPVGGRSFPPGQVTVRSFGQVWEFNAE